jgi:hypothetical protein
MRFTAAIALLPLFPQDPAPKPGETVVQAVDRLARKLTLLKGHTQVVWLIDASASMDSHRRELAERIDRIFESVPKENRLSMAVATFSNRIHRASDFVTDAAKARQAILEKPKGGSGNERPLTAAEEASQWFGSRGHNILVLVTDERGDDLDRLEEVLDVLRRNLVNVFAIGPSAPFQWPHRYLRDPTSGELIPTQAGPESLGFETLVANPICCSQRGRPNYGQIYPGCRRLLIDSRVQEFSKLHAHVDPLGCDLIFEDIPSGYGPWGLSRLAARTGGEFITADPPGPPAYAPDWTETVSGYRTANSRHPLRKAVTEVVAEFHKAGASGLIASDEVGIAGGQARAAERFDAKCAAWIDRLDKAPAEDAPRRWLANRDLVRAQLAAMRHWLEEYALAFREDLKGLVGSHYRVVPGSARGAGERRKEAETAATATAESHSGTAWGATATRLKERLQGFRVTGFTPTNQPIVPPAPR